MDAPELNGDTECEGRLALSAKAFAEAFLNSDEIRIENVGYAVYGLVLADGHFRGQYWEQAVLDHGLARQYTPSRHGGWYY
ncbi:MAG: hypothetical protein M3120_10565 [Pseudomonadota bacterium]|nr:hypothetical protein [Pseudomonadota bacterium]